jgi:pantoate kinase
MKSATATREIAQPHTETGTWLDQVTRNPSLDEAIATFVGSIHFLRRVGLSDEEIRRLCQINLLYVRRGPAQAPR